MANTTLSEPVRVHAAEVISGLSVATDLGTGLPLEHGLESTLLAIRLADRLGVDDETAMQTYGQAMPGSGSHQKRRSLEPCREAQ